MNEIIPYHRPFPLSEDDINNIILKMKHCLKEGTLTNGQNVKMLEDKIKNLYDVDYCIATSNCTMGLYLSFKHYDWLGPLHMANFTWPSFYHLLDSGLDIILHDIDIETWLMDIPDTYGIVMPTFTFGSTIEYEHGKHVVINDAAHALGATIGDIGDATVFSLAPTKLVTSCEGGLVITDDAKLASHLLDKRDKCARMSEFHAIVGLQTLRYLDRIKKWKKKVYDYYKLMIPGVFQKIPLTSNYNTIGFYNIDGLMIPTHITTKQYYEPIEKGMLNCDLLYSKIICLPSYYNCDYKKIVDDILELNEL